MIEWGIESTDVLRWLSTIVVIGALVGNAVFYRSNFQASRRKDFWRQNSTHFFRSTIPNTIAVCLSVLTTHLFFGSGAFFFQNLGESIRHSNFLCFALGIISALLSLTNRKYSDKPLHTSACTYFFLSLLMPFLALPFEDPAAIWSVTGNLLTLMICLALGKFMPIGASNPLAANGAIEKEPPETSLFSKRDKTDKS